MSSLPTRVYLGAGLLLLVTVAAYIPAIRGGFVWDDDLYVTHNPALRGFDGLRRIWFEIRATPQYYPLVFTSFWFERGLWGLNPLGYHLVNVLLHGLGAILLWLVLRRLSVPGAWLAAGIFALHPVHVESAAWITERKNVLSGVFCLAALLVYLRLCRLDPDEPADPRPGRSYGWALVLFICALLSKTVTCCLPAVILLLLWWKRERLGRRDVRPLAPMFAMGLLMGLGTALIEKYGVRAQGEEWELSFIERCLVAGRALWFYAGKLIRPTGLTFTYPRWRIDSALWWQYLYPAAAVSVIISLWLLRRRIGKAPLAAVLIFAGTLFPALGFIDVYPMRYSFVADHFQYLASIALITPFAALLTTAMGMLPRHLGRGGASAGGFGWTAIPQVLLGAAVLSVLGALTWDQAKLYRNLETLWRDTLAKNPAAWMAHNNLARLLDEREDFEEARSHYLEAIRLKPHYLHYYNLGSMLARRGKYQEAVHYLTEALRIDSELPDVHYNLGNIRAMQGRLTEAAHHFSEVVRIDPDDPEAHWQLGAVLVRQGRVRQGVAQYHQALRLKPGWPAVADELAHVLATHRDLDLGQ